ncbi:MAG: class I tRNA ligase family protein, partial [Acidimicrobiales bacterium]
DRFSAWWPSVHHLLGKDIIRFHCVWWPAMCMAAGIDPPRHYLVHGFLLVGGKKMGKTAFNQVDPVELGEDVGNDALRHYLVRDFPLGGDGEFTYEAMIERYNADLANNLGNLFSRVATVVGSKCAGIGPPPRRDLSDTPAGTRLAKTASAVTAEVGRAWDRYAPHEALEAVWRLIRAANSELEEAEPWKLEPGPEVDAVLGDALEVLRIVAVLVSPVLPDTAREIWVRLGIEGSPDAPGNAGPDGVTGWGGYPGGVPVTKGTPLFPRRKAEV